MSRLELALQALFASLSAAAGVFVKNPNSQKQVNSYLNLATVIAGSIAAVKAAKSNPQAALTPQ